MVATILLTSCGTSKKLALQKETANSYFVSDNFSDALLAYQDIIKVYEDNNNQSACPVYTNAGISACKTGDYDMAISYLKKDINTDFANDNTYYYLALAYQQIDNLSLEIGTLTDYLSKYPDGSYVGAVKLRLYFTYVESDNYDKAVALWPEVYVNNVKNLKLLESYLYVNDKLNKNDVCDDLAVKLLELDAKNAVALSWMGKKYYQKAIKRYRKEMKAYEKHKTNKQYRILLGALDKVTADYKKALGYFKTLYSVNPTKENANYLSHIYGSLSDKKKEAYYKKLGE